MTLQKAFVKVINTRGLLTSRGYSRFDVANFKRLKISDEKKREVLRSAGFKKIQDELWEPPPIL